MSPLCLGTKLDESPFLERTKSGGSSSLVRRQNGGIADDERRDNYSSLFASKTFASSERRRGWRPKGLAQLDEHCDLLQLVEP